MAEWSVKARDRLCVLLAEHTGRRIAGVRIQECVDISSSCESLSRAVRVLSVVRQHGASMHYNSVVVSEYVTEPIVGRTAGLVQDCPGMGRRVLAVGHPDPEGGCNPSIT